MRFGDLMRNHIPGGTAVWSGLKSTVTSNGFEGGGAATAVAGFFTAGGAWAHESTKHPDTRLARIQKETIARNVSAARSGLQLDLARRRF